MTLVLLTALSVWVLMLVMDADERRGASCSRARSRCSVARRSASFAHWFLRRRDPQEPLATPGRPAGAEGEQYVNRYAGQRLRIAQIRRRCGSASLSCS